MSDKQLGAAPEPKPEAGYGSGWFTGLRAQPGFRTASVAFFLTVILGVGGTAAFAYWSQSTAVTIVGTTPRPPTPVPTSVTCRTSPVQVTWPAVSGADPEVRYIMSLQAPAANFSAVYALPAEKPGTWAVDPLKLVPSSSFRQTSGSSSIPVTATVRTAIVKPTVPATAVAVAESDLVYPSTPSAPVKMTLKISSSAPTLSCG